MIRLTNENYFCEQANREYMSVSQFKQFEKCEATAMATDYVRPMTTALLVGSYVDAYFEGTLDIFKAQHPEIFKKDGNLKADYVKAEDIIERVERDEYWMSYMSGEKQTIFTAEMFGCMWKIKIDSLCEDKIVDLKCMANAKWGYDERQNKYTNFIELWGYDIQLAVYQEVYFRATGKRLPCYIAYCTKEPTPDHDIVEIPQYRLDECLEYVGKLMPHILAVKRGEVKAERCGTCDYCKQTKVVEKPVPFDLAGLSERERKEWE